VKRKRRPSFRELTALATADRCAVRAGLGDVPSEGICQCIALIPLTVVTIVISVLLLTVLYSVLDCEFLNKINRGEDEKAGAD